MTSTPHAPAHKAEFIRQIEEAIGAHAAWPVELRSTLATGRSALTPSRAACDDRCALGRWLHGGPLPQQMRGASFEAVKRLHRDFHQAAGTVLDMALSGDRMAARGALEGALVPATARLSQALEGWKSAL